MHRAPNTISQGVSIGWIRERDDRIYDSNVQSTEGVHRQDPGLSDPNSLLLRFRHCLATEVGLAFPRLLYLPSVAIALVVL